ncbi:MAG: hypothetical protein WD872_02980 [Pirellulaceae bacterium]
MATVSTNPMFPGGTPATLDNGFAVPNVCTPEELMGDVETDDE